MPLLTFFLNFRSLLMSVLSVMMTKAPLWSKKRPLWTSNVRNLTGKDSRKATMTTSMVKDGGRNITSMAKTRNAVPKKKKIILPSE